MDSRLRTVFLVDVSGCSLEEPAFRRCGRRSPPFLFVCSETPGRRSRGWHQESLPREEGTDKVPAIATVQHAALVCAARACLPLGPKLNFCECVGVSSSPCTASNSTTSTMQGIRGPFRTSFYLICCYRHARSEAVLVSCVVERSLAPCLYA